jgi:hypothetical protein
MSQRKKRFEPKRKPQYLVLTSCRPEEIDSASLKFRDLQVLYEIMCEHSARYVQAIEEEQARCGKALDLNAPVPASVRRLEDLIRTLFTSMLTNYESIIHYIRDAVRNDEESSALLADLLGKDEVLNSLERLRNMDVHHEALHTLIGTRYRILGASAAFSSIETREVHQHFQLQHEGVGFYPAALAKTRQFIRQPGLVEFVTYTSILQLAHSCVHAVANLLNDPVIREGLGTSGKYACLACRQPE